MSSSPPPALAFPNDHDADLADLELGRLIREMVAAKSDPDTAGKFCDALIIPTRPGTLERITQDRVFETLTARIGKLVTGAAA